MRALGAWRAAAFALALALALTVGPDSAVAQASLTTAMVSARRSVARVVSEECASGPSRVGTAFLWRDSSTIVTARHVVAGCGRITAVFTVSGKSYRAFPDRELKARDLVALRLEQASDSPPLPVSNGLPAVGAHVAALGFPYGAPTLDSKELQVTLANAPPGSKLADMLGDSLLQTLRRSGELDVQTRVLRLDGNLLPGLSGAPLLASNGVVYAVGSGGIQEGAGGVVWAVRAEYLEQLAAQPRVTAFAAIPRSSGLTFAVQTQQATVGTVRCGASTFRRARQASLSDLYSGTDDQLGLLQLAATFFLSAQDINQMLFEIWVDPASGAAIAVPAGAVLQPTNATTCGAHVGPGVDLTIGATATNGSPMQVQAASSAFEFALAGGFSGPLGPDPSFTYPAARFRPDGFVARRVAFGANRPTAEYGKVVGDYAFITHMARGQRYVAIAASRRGIIYDMVKMQSCAQAPQSAICGQLRRDFTPWARAAIATHLATMPPI